MSSQPKILLSESEYLARERLASFKSEYFRGETFAMAGASERHNLIVLNIGAELRNQLKKRPCRVYPSDLRVKVKHSGLITYPDVTVVCGKNELLSEHGDVMLNPIVIVEVLSDSTEAYDRGKKFERYRTIESLQEYVLISQDRVSVEWFTRSKDHAGWSLNATQDIQGELRLDSIECVVPVAEIYDKVVLDPTTEE